MAITIQQLNQLRDDLLEGFRTTFTNTFNNETSKVFDSNGNELHLTGNRDDRRAYYDALFEQNRNDRLAQIDRQIAEIRGHSALEVRLLEKLNEEKERINNGGVSQKDIKLDKFKNLTKKVAAITQIIQAGVDAYVAIGERNLAVTEAYYNKSFKLMSLNLEYQGKILSQGMKSIRNGFNKNVNEMAFDSTQSTYELVKTASQVRLEGAIAEKTYKKDVKKANVEMTGSLIAAGAMAGAAIGSFFGPVGTAVGALVGLVGGLAASSYKKIMGLDIKQKELDIKVDEQVQKQTEAFLTNIANITKPWDELYKQTSDFVLNINKAGKIFGVTVGFTSDKFANTILDMSQKTVVKGNTLAKVFGKEVEKIPEYMDNYISTSGRAVGLSANDIGNIMATGRLFGMSGQESTQLYGSMNVFNTSVTSAADSMGIMYHQITRMGLSTKKFGKDLVQNLKLAQKYNFKGGVDNMMKLTKWAQQTRFNLNSAASFADSILEGTLSEALEKSARLQVLGGAAAIYSDPLGMLYDAGANVGDLARRQAAMFSDLTGTFNAKTGETDFSWYENKMIRERAKAAGLNVEDVFNQIRQTNKQGVIDKLLGGMDEEDRIAIGNRATYNKKKGRWEVTDIKGNVHDIQEYKNNEARIDDLLPKDTQEAMLVVAEKSLSHLERTDNYVEHIATKLGAEKKTVIFETVDRELSELQNFYNNNWDKVNTAWEQARKFSEDSFKANISLMKWGANHIQDLTMIYHGFLHDLTDISEMSGEDLINFQFAVDKFYTGGARSLAAFFKGGVDPSSIEWQTEANELMVRSGIYMPKALQEQIQKMEDEGALPPGTAAQYDNNAIQQRLINNRQLMQKIRDTYIASQTESEDGTGYTNGGIMFGASNVKSINDGAVNVKTAKRDQYLVAQTGGPIDILLKQLLPGLQALLSGNGGSNNVNLNLNGRLELSQDGSSVNLVELIKNDPAMATKFLAVLQKTMEVNQNGRAIRNRMIS